MRTRGPNIAGTAPSQWRTIRLLRRVATPCRSVSTRGLALSVSVALVTLSLVAGVATAADGRDHRNAENTFTKWAIDTAPGPGVVFNMAGVVGGDVGPGGFAGEVLSLDVACPTLTIDARYHFNGSQHSFSALVHVVQTGCTVGGTAVITGVVTDGWLKGNQLAGSYDVISCSHTNGVTTDIITTDCFQGTLDILKGSKES